MARPLAIFLLLVACDSPGAGGPSAVVPDSVTDTQPDTAPDTAPDDTFVEDTFVPDTIAPDTTPDAPDTTVSTCQQGCLPAITATAPRGVAFQQYPSGPALVLNGGAQPTGDWVLTAIEVRPNQTFADGIDVRIANAGQTAGRSNFNGDAIMMALDLHLSIIVTVLGTTGTDTARQEVAVGGCHSVVGTRLVGQLDTCARGFPASTPPPSSLDFQLDTNTLAIGLSLSRAQLIALLPEEDRASGELAITGPLYLIARFSRP